LKSPLLAYLLKSANQGILYQKQSLPGEGIGYFKLADIG